MPINNEQTSMKSVSNQSGFSTVELLVTLFVAAAFLMSGYQLYAMIIKNNGEASARAKASNTAYQYMQQYKSDSGLIQKPCYPSPTPTVLSPIIDGLSNVSINVSVSCPYPSTTSISKLTVTVKYGNNSPQQQVVDATYVNKD